MELVVFYGLMEKCYQEKGSSIFITSGKAQVRWPYALLVNSALKVEVSVGTEKGSCIVKRKRPFMRRLKESGLFTVGNGDQFIERSLINRGKDRRTLKSRDIVDTKINAVSQSWMNTALKFWNRFISLQDFEISFQTMWWGKKTLFNTKLNKFY